MRRYTLWFFVLLSLACSAASAQPTSKKNKRQEVEEKLKEYRHYVLQTELGLDDATAAKLFAVTDPMLDQMKDLRIEIKKINDEILLEAAKPKPDEKKLNEALDLISKKELEYQTLRVGTFDKTKGVLAPIQRVQLLQIMADLDRKIRDMIREAKTSKTPPQKK